MVCKLQAYAEAGGQRLHTNRTGRVSNRDESTDERAFLSDARLDYQDQALAQNHLHSMRGQPAAASRTGTGSKEGIRRGQEGRHYLKRVDSKFAQLPEVATLRCMEAKVMAAVKP